LIHSDLPVVSPIVCTTARKVNRRACWIFARSRAMMEKITTRGFPMKKQLTAWLLALVMLFSLVGCGTDAPVQDETNLPQQEQQDVQNAPSEDADTPDETAQIDEDGSYTTKDDVALYIHTYGHLPDNFITKKDAQALGWPGGSLQPQAPGQRHGRRPVRHQH